MRAIAWLLTAIAAIVPAAVIAPSAVADVSTATVRATSTGYDPCSGDACNDPVTFTVSKPTGTAAADLLVAVQFYNPAAAGTGTPVIPTGFTVAGYVPPHGFSPAIRVYTAPGSASAPYTFGDSGGSVVAVMAISNGGALNVTPSFSQVSGNASTSQTCNSVTPTISNALLLCGAVTGASYSANSPLTLQANVSAPSNVVAGVGAQSLSGGANTATGTRSLNAGAVIGSYTTVALAVGRSFAPGVHWQYQLSGTVDETALDSYSGPKIYDIDMFGATAAMISRLHNKGIEVICYVESGDYNSTRPDAGDYPSTILGNAISGFPTEKFVNVNALNSPTGPTGKTFHQIMDARLDLAASKGCDGIDPDLDDTYTYTTGFTITQASNESYDATIISDAHSRGMGAGLKNGADPNGTFDSDMLSNGADWVVNEECNQYSECGGYPQFIAAGRAVLQVEYLDNQTVPYSGTSGTCATDNTANFDGIVKDSSGSLAASPLIECR